MQALCPVLNWKCQLMQVNRYNGHKMVVVVHVLFGDIIIIIYNDRKLCTSDKFCY